MTIAPLMRSILEFGSRRSWGCGICERISSSRSTSSNSTVVAVGGRFSTPNHSSTNRRSAPWVPPAAKAADKSKVTEPNVADLQIRSAGRGRTARRKPRRSVSVSVHDLMFEEAIGLMFEEAIAAQIPTARTAHHCASTARIARLIPARTQAIITCGNAQTRAASPAKCLTSWHD